MIKLKIKKKYLVIAVVAVVAIAFYYVFFNGSQSSGQYDDFAKCLTEKGAKMFGAYWCSHCKSQKEMFGSSLKYITYVECDPNGDNPNPDFCSQNSISGYPTWIINGTHYEGKLSLERLSSLTGCPLE